LLLNPGTGGFFAATGAKSALAGEKDMLCMGTYLGISINRAAPFFMDLVVLLCIALESEMPKMR